MVTRVAPSPVFKRKGDNLEVEVPITIVEAVRGGTVEVPTLSGTKQIRIPAGTQDGTVQRLRGEGPAEALRLRAGETSTTAFGSRCRRRSTTEQREAIERLAEVMNGDPRADLLQRARARS